MKYQQGKVLVVDDNIVARKYICNAIGADYLTQTANDGDQGIEMALEWQPDLILLDVEMPGKNGFEVCDRLKVNEKTCDIPIIFISGNASLRERMVGYEMGADDYLVKPCEKEIIKAKTDRIFELYSHQNQLHQQVTEARVVAQEAMLGSAELGKAIRFIESTFEITNFDQLAVALFRILAEMQLSSSLMFISNQGELFFSPGTKPVSPLERELLQLVQKQDRFYDFGCRTICNFPRVSLLIKNMPLDNRESYGRLKDSLPFMLNTINEKIQNLDTRNRMLEQTEALTRTTDVIRTTLNNLSQSANHSQQQISHIMEQTLADFDELMPGLGLEEDQEKLIISRLDQTFQDSLTCLAEGKNLTQSLDSIIRLLNHLIAQQKLIVAETLEVTPTQLNETKLDEDNNFTDSNDVELF